jgi:hypothetical protein
VGVEKIKRLREQELTNDQATRRRADSACGERVLTITRPELAGLRMKCETLVSSKES